MSKKSKPTSARDARLAQARRDQQAKERRRTYLLVGVTAVIIVAIVAMVGYAVVSEADDREAAGDLAAVKEYDYEGGNHVQGEIDYQESPPVGGEHNPIWLNCGVYDEPVPNQHAVHSLEHGTVWVTYDPELPDSEVEKLEQALPDTYTLLSPYEGEMPSKVVASAWGHQLALESADDPRLQGFIKEYRQGPQTPEPGAACTGGVDASGVVSQ
ncbi:DUF3105 domain-containing protein [Janibacter cremeus]|uniref:DUF3105 domain-containing protein n=1 Tax=Janibacter cremeus TaxID=1285192 RepID=A0A852VY04_9MICO|nr:DUF3105 domain-containing protein [Janibacter cremeus]NYF98391.1 hypothetical protein [Janibacter cremeus]